MLVSAVDFLNSKIVNTSMESSLGKILKSYEDMVWLDFAAAYFWKTKDRVFDSYKDCSCLCPVFKTVSSFHGRSAMM